MATLHADLSAMFPQVWDYTTTNSALVKRTREKKLELGIIGEMQQAAGGGNTKTVVTD